ncbi:hypothetical protein SPRG_10820 [Saprolegnia parasitica CBS 223.65]|uniref:Complex 1 LYR protein domain-containing protein n=1 Tax=Saprolegnia parasitica (strain CBS 223.65) TaxID=695850 RepID=A0A067CB30_SAPPC|nr:hypothetical protein SPRG_10820 [Saprolegnia parasitica CBS 223.65]KDO24032.1 hypothetical protein SPRG_10820 [Saprolegnia parasitica CBS 223.65]|eukprot:XP_012205170.1 hypothetical protein SPRG_10820 [Saprolegnia parasitica CBS 223.65]
MAAKKPFLSFGYFINRSQVLKQYRLYLREIAPLAPPARNDLRKTIRAKFEEAKDLTDERLVKQAIAYGNSQMQHVRELVNSVGPTKPHVDASAKATWVDSPSTAGSEDDGAMEDVRGRLGAGWPWQRS